MAGIRITDVAEKAKVSTTTVSFVLNGIGSVSEATRQRVFRVMNDLGYEPSSMARALRARHTGTVGMLVPDLFGAYFFTLFAGVEDAVAEKGYVCFLGNANEDAQREEKYVRRLFRWQVDGLILAPLVGFGRSTPESLVREKVPVIFVDRGPEVLGLAADAYPSVVTANRDAAREMTAYLLESCSGPVGLISPDVPNGPVLLRCEGYRDAVQRSGQKPMEAMERGDNRELGYALAARLLDGPQRPAAIFATTNPCGLGAYLAMSERGLRTPQDVHLAVFDDSDWAEVAGVSVVRTDPYRIGYTAASVLLQVLAEHPLSSPQVTVPAKIILRHPWTDHRSGSPSSG